MARLALLKKPAPSTRRRVREKARAVRSPALSTRRAELRPDALVQTKLEIHESDDEFEQEADQVASQMMSSSGGESSGEAPPRSSTRLGTIQRATENDDRSKESEDEELQLEEDAEALGEEEDVQLKEEEPEEDVALQMKGDDSAPDEEGDLQLEEAEDPDEEDVQLKEAPEISREEELQHEEDDSRSAEEDDLQLEEAEDPDEDDVQLEEEEDIGESSVRSLEEELRAARAEDGRALPAEIRSWAARSLGPAAEQARVHTGERAQALARSLGARAFTQGQHIYFKRGAYEPGSWSGKKLLAHELTHVVQQRMGMQRGSVLRQIEQRGAPPVQQRSGQELWSRRGDGALVPQLRPRWFVGSSADGVAEAFGISRGAQPEGILQIVRALLELGLRQDPERLQGLSEPAVSQSSCVVRSGEHELELRAEAGTQGIWRTFRLSKTAPAGAGAAPVLARGGKWAESGAALPWGSERGVVDVSRPGLPLLVDEGVAIAVEEASREARERVEGREREAREQQVSPAQGEPEGVEALASPQPSEAEPSPEPVRGETEELAQLGAEPPRLMGVSEATEEAEAGPREEAARINAAVEAIASAPAASQVEAPLEELTAPTESGAEAAAESPEGAPAAAALVAEAALAPTGAPTAPSPIPEPEIPAVEPQVEADALEARLEAAVGSDSTEVDASEEEFTPEPSEELGALGATGSESQLASAGSSLNENEDPEVATARIERETRQEEQQAATFEASQTAEAESEAAALEGEGASELEEVGEEAATESLLPEERGVALEALSEGAFPSLALGGSGAGGGIAQAEPEPAAPEVSSLEPTAALGAVSGLKVGQMQEALGGVRASVSADTAQRQEELAAAPPEMERPTGAPITRAEAQAIPPARDLGLGADARQIDAVPAGPEVKTPEPEPLPVAPPAAIAQARAPQVGTAEGETLTPEAALAVRSQLSRLPTEDPALAATAGPAPALLLEGNANPERMLLQHEEFREKVVEARAKGAAEAAQPLGEDLLYPDVPEETLKANVSGGAKAAAVGESAGAPELSVALLAEAEKGEEVRGAAGQAREQAEAAELKQTEDAALATSEHAEAVAEAETENAAEQSVERERAKGEVMDARGAWSQAQQEELLEKDEIASLELSEAAGEIAEEKREADAEAAEEIESGNETAREAQREGEQKAEQERAKGAQESGGIFEWVASRAKAFFEKVKSAISAALEAARVLVKAAIERAQELAVAAIEKARQAAVELIQAAGDFLIELGGALLSNFPALREKWTQTIQGLVAAAEAGINRLAEALKTAVVALLDVFAGALEFALGLLEKGLHAAVDFLASAVDGAIQFAKSVADKLGTFAELISDIAADPGGWIRNLGAAVVDGIKNHLWGALKSAVSEWFGSKVEGLLSVGKTVWSLVTGELGLSAVAQMAWEAVQGLIPPTLTRILVEKLVAMIVPAAGALLAIVEALQAAWGTVSRMIAAIDTFIAFLKAVKSGGAGAKFAAALASAAVVVLDFVANYLIAKLGSGLRALSGKLMGLAARLGKKRRGAKAKRGRASGRGKPRRKTEAKRKKKPGTLRAKGQTARKSNEQRKREKKKHDAEKRLHRAMGQIRGGLRKPTEQKKAQALMRRIARRNRVQISFNDPGRGLGVSLRVNPKLDAFFKGEDLKQVIQKLKDAGRSVRSVEIALTTRWKARLARILGEGSEQRGASLRKPEGATQSAGEQAASEVLGEFGEIEAVRKRGFSDIVDEGSALNESEKRGRQFEDESIAGFLELTQSIGGVGRYGPAGDQVVVLPGRIGPEITKQDPQLAELYNEVRGTNGSRTGADVLVVNLTRGEVVNVELKGGVLRAITQKESRKTPQSFDAEKMVEAGKAVKVSGAGAEVAEKHAEELAKKKVLFVEREKDGKIIVIENQLSALTTEFETGLEKAIQELRSMIRLANERSLDVAPLKSALQLLERAILTKPAGKIRRIVRSKKEPEPAQMRAIEAVLEASARHLGIVESREGAVVAQLQGKDILKS